MTPGTERSGPRASLLVILPGTEFRVALDRRVNSIGADSGCTLSIENQGLAPHHCIIQRDEDGGFELFDLSGGRVTVNGGPVQATPLRCGDQIALGDVKLAFLTELEAVASAREAILGGNKTPAVSAAAAESKLDEGVLSLAEDSWESARGTGEDPERHRKTRRAASAAAEVEAAGEDSEAGRRLPRLGFPPIGRWLKQAFVVPLTRASEAVVDLRRTTEVIPRPPQALSGYSSLQAAVEALEPHHPAHREHVSFGAAAIDGLRKTPYVVCSLAVHAVLLIVLSLLNTPVAVDYSIPPHHSSLDYGGELDGLQEEDAADENPEVEVEEPSEVDYPEPTEENELVAAIGESGNTEGSEINDAPASRDLFTGGAGLRGLGSAGQSGAIAVGNDSFGKSIRKLRASGLDIVFVIDSTGSMNEIIEETRIQVEGMIAHLASLVPGFRLGLVTFRDEGDLYVTRREPLTPWAYQIVDFLDTITAGGGGDHPEAVYEALRTAKDRMLWSPKAQRIMILIGDAPPHPGEVEATIRLAKRFAARGGTIHTVFTDTGNGLGSSDRQSYVDIARAAGGTHVPLAERQRVVQSIVEVAVGSQHSANLKASFKKGEEGWRGRAHRRLVKEADASRILKELKRKPVREAFLRELVRHNRETFLPAYLEVLSDPDAPPQARWACTVLIKRLIRDTEPSVGLATAVDTLSPDLGSRGLRRALKTFKKRAKEAGFLTELK